MGAMIHYNPSTDKVSYDTSTDKVQVGDTPTCGNDCSGNVALPSSVFMAISGLSFPSGCCVIGATSYDNWDWPISNDTYELIKSGDCMWQSFVGNVTADHWATQSCSVSLGSIDIDVYLRFSIQLSSAPGDMRAQIILNNFYPNLFSGYASFGVDCDTTLLDLWDEGSVIIDTNRLDIVYSTCKPGGTLTITF